MEALLEYRQTDVCYGGVRAVRGVSFTLHAGEILGVVGESGCGKSTLLRAAMGLLGPGGLVTGGKILYRGENLPDLSARARRRLNGPELGMIFQSAGSAFCPIRTVGAQLYEAMREHGKISKALFEERALEMLAKQMNKHIREIGTYPVTISHGDCQEDAEYLKEYILSHTAVEQVEIHMLDTVIGAHAGPGTVALFCYGDKRGE